MTVLIFGKRFFLVSKLATRWRIQTFIRTDTGFVHGFFLSRNKLRGGKKNHKYLCLSVCRRTCVPFYRLVPCVFDYASLQGIGSRREKRDDSWCNTNPTAIRFFPPSLFPVNRVDILYPARCASRRRTLATRKKRRNGAWREWRRCGFALTSQIIIRRTSLPAVSRLTNTTTINKQKKPDELLAL